MRALFILFILASCFNNADTPEAAIMDFVNARLDKVVSRSEVLDRTTGKMKLSLESMTDEEFNTYANLKDFKKESLKIISKSCQDKKCYVTYSVGYKQVKASKTGWMSEIKKIAEVMRVEGKWLISDVTNIKTYHETGEAIEITP